VNTLAAQGLHAESIVAAAGMSGARDYSIE
jgi:hypothetical protein